MPTRKKGAVVESRANNKPKQIIARKPHKRGENVNNNNNNNNDNISKAPFPNGPKALFTIRKLFFEKTVFDFFEIASPAPRNQVSAT